MPTENLKATDIEGLTRELMNLDEGDRLQVISKGLMWTHYQRKETNFELNINIPNNNLVMNINSELIESEVDDE